MSPVKARIGISLFFFTNGAIFTNIVPRLPEIKRDFLLGDSAYGLMIALISVGSLLAVSVTVQLLKRLGAINTGLFGTFLLCASAALIGWASNVIVLALAFASFGFLDAIVDSAQNVHGVRVEDYNDRSIMNSLHALWSLGAALGSLMGSACAGLGIGRGVHLSVVALALAIVAFFACKMAKMPEGFSVSSNQNPEQKLKFRLPRPVLVTLLALGVLAIAGVVIEDLGSGWSILYLIREVSAPIGIAGLGYTAIIGAQFVGRILGDLLIDKYGRRRILLVGGLAICVGGVLVVGLPTTWTVMLGYLFAGYGCATVVPTAYASAGRIPGLPEGFGITVASWMLRIGLLLNPPIVGLISQATSLRAAMSLMLVSGLVIVALAGKTRIQSVR